MLVAGCSGYICSCFLKGFKDQIHKGSYFENLSSWNSLTSDHSKFDDGFSCFKDELCRMCCKVLLLLDFISYHIIRFKDKIVT